MRPVQLWFARTLRDGKALAITRQFATFKDVGGFQLKALISRQREGQEEKPSQEELESATATVLGATPSNHFECSRRDYDVDM